MTVDEETQKLEIWDTAGQERFKSLAPMYYKGCKAAILVFDITSETSFDKMRYWVDDLKNHLDKAPDVAVVVVVGNKKDLESERVVSSDKAEKYVGELSTDLGRTVIYRECSAKTGEGVRELFEDICRNVIPNDNCVEPPKTTSRHSHHGPPVR